MLKDLILSSFVHLISVLICLYLKRSLPSRQGLAPLPWTDFFELELSLEEDIGELHIVHHAYLIPPSKSGPLFVMHHGAGSSGLSFAACAGEIRNILPTAGILSIDARGHGSTTLKRTDFQSNEQPEADLSLETLSRDIAFVVKQTQNRMKWEELPDLVLVGHSLGGAVMTDVAKKAELGSKVLAYAVLDVVEGIVYGNPLNQQI